MAKKKTKARKNSSKRKAPAKVRTKFMSSFTKEFIHDSETDTWKWPTETQSNESALVDFKTFMDVLMHSGYLGQPVLAGSGNSLRNRIARFLKGPIWPGIPTTVPKKWRKEQRTVHLIEISVIADRLLHAMNEPRGAGGGPSVWPPH